tara:strand:- start:1469 stop:2434 length:966 start_codon:yes stop_codon:yes gene_type:complete
VKAIISEIQNKYLRVKTINYGASLFEVYHKANKTNLILNLGSKENYKFKNFSVGATCGRFAGRISNSGFLIGNQKYILSKNQGKNTLHGGKKGFSILPWKKIKHTKQKVIYQIKSKDMDQGFPGNLLVNCIYELKNKFLSINYEYSSDKPTHVNLTNHSYWNLNKNKNNKLYDHDLKINSKKYLELNKSQIPTGKIKKVKNKIYNFINFKNLNEKLNYFIRNKKTGKLGFDITYVVTKNKKNYVASLRNIKNNVRIDFFSDLPAIQLYTAQNLIYKRKLFPYMGVCLETQYYPDSPNKKKFPNTLIKPNKIYKCFTKIKIN